MADEEKILPEEETETQPNETAEAKSLFQTQKENWYDKVPLNLKQLDTIIVIGLILLALTFVVMFLDAADIINPFGY